MNETTHEQINRVSRGAALLDEVRPGWENEINLDNLDIGDSQNCVLGQLFGSFGAGLAYLSDIAINTAGKAVHRPSHFGFNSSTSEQDYSEQYVILNALWAEEILDRLGDAALD